MTVTIVEDDVPTLAMAPAQASEQAARIAFAVTLSQASDEVVSVNYATSGATAIEGQGLHGGERHAAVSGADDGGADDRRDGERRQHG